MPGKRIAAILFAAAAAGSASAQEATLESVVACKLIEAPMERVACYDLAVGRLQAAEAAGEVTVVTRADVEKVKRESFGFSIPSLPSFSGLGGGSDAGELSRVTEPVQSVSGSASGLRVKLANGQVWIQIDDKNVRAKSVESAEIYQAALGSFKMKLDGGLAFRVRREQ
jgi:hypothetical protein